MPETWRAGAVLRQRRWFNLHGIELAMATPTVISLILIYFLCTFAFGNFETTLALLNKEVLGFADKNNFWVFAYVGLVLTVVQGGLYRFLAKRGMPEIHCMLLGASLMILGLGLIGAATAFVGVESTVGWSLLLVFLLAMTASVTGFAFVTPSVPALISRRTDPTRQGEILGVNQSANALSRILGPVAGIGLYYQRPLHVLPYAFAVALLVVVLGLTLRVRQPCGA
jgi:hypothetical protein